MAVGHSEGELESLRKASENYKPDVSVRCPGSEVMAFEREIVD